MKISILRKQQWEVAAFAFDECFNVFGVYSILDLDDKDGVTVEKQDVVFFWLSRVEPTTFLKIESNCFPTSTGLCLREL